MAALPPGWRRLVSPNGETFYQNDVNLTTQWDPPPMPAPQEGPPPPAVPPVPSAVPGRNGYARVGPDNGLPVVDAMGRPVAPFRDTFKQSLFVTFCCFWPLGLYTLYLSSKANTAYARGDRIQAGVLSAQARSINKWAMCVGLVCMALFGTFIAIAISGHHRWHHHHGHHGRHGGKGDWERDDDMKDAGWMSREKDWGFKANYYCAKDKAQMGHDLSFENSDTAEECASSCDSKSACMGFDYNPDSEADFTCALSNAKRMDAPLSDDIEGWLSCEKKSVLECADCKRFPLTLTSSQGKAVVYADKFAIHQDGINGHGMKLAVGSSDAIVLMWDGKVLRHAEYPDLALDVAFAKNEEGNSLTLWSNDGHPEWTQQFELLADGTLSPEGSSLVVGWGPCHRYDLDGEMFLVLVQKGDPKQLVFTTGLAHKDLAP